MSLPLAVTRAASVAAEMFSRMNMHGRQCGSHPCVRSSEQHIDQDHELRMDMVDRPVAEFQVVVPGGWRGGGSGGLHVDLLVSAASVHAAWDGDLELAAHGAFQMKRQETLPKAPTEACTRSPAATGIIGPRAPDRIT